MESKELSFLHIVMKAFKSEILSAHWSSELG